MMMSKLRVDRSAIVGAGGQKYAKKQADEVV